MPGRKNLRHARKLWAKNGGKIEDVRRTGEQRFTHPDFPKPITVNKRRKDTPRALYAPLGRLLRQHRRRDNA